MSNQTIQEKLKVIEHYLRGGEIQRRPDLCDYYVDFDSHFKNELNILIVNDIRIAKKKVKKYQVLYQLACNGEFEVSKYKHPNLKGFEHCRSATLILDSEEEFDE